MLNGQFLAAFVSMVLNLHADIRISRPGRSVSCAGFRAEGLTQGAPSTYRCGATVTWRNNAKEKRTRCRRTPTTLGMGWSYECKGPFRDADLRFHIRCRSDSTDKVFEKHRRLSCLKGDAHQ